MIRLLLISLISVNYIFSDENHDHSHHHDIYVQGEKLEVDQERFKNFLNGLSKHLRELLISSLNSSDKLSDYKNELSKRYLDHSKDISNNDLISMIEIINDTLINYQKVNDKRIHLELCLMKLASLDSIKKKSL